MAFFLFDQSNIHGRYVQTALLDVYVFVEASCAAEANAVMTVLGADFDARCECCGLRWHTATEEMAQERPLLHVRGVGELIATDGIPAYPRATSERVRVWTMPRLVDALAKSQLQALATHREVYGRLKYLAADRLAGRTANEARRTANEARRTAVALTERAVEQYEVSAALNFEPVAGDLTAIRREMSCGPFASGKAPRHPGARKSLKAQKAAAHRNARRESRELLGRMLRGHDLGHALRSVSTPRLTGGAGCGYLFS